MRPSNPLLLLSRAQLWRATALACFLGSSALTFGQSTRTLLAWGANDSLQSQPPPGLNNLVALAAGESHSLALLPNGTVIAWGFNVSGQSTVPTNLTGVIAIAGGGSYSMALKQDGTVVVWGAQTPPPPDLANVTAIAAGWSHSLALKNDGTVVSWGTQTAVPVFATNVVAISAGRDFSLALIADGTVVAWGDDTYGEVDVPSGLTNVAAISAGGGHALALQRSGRLVSWGRNDYGQATVPQSATNILTIGGGALHSVALKSDGSLLAWGNDVYGQVSNTPTGANFLTLAAGGYHNLALQGDGSPAIYLQPLSQTVEVGGTATFQVGALGLPPLRYQWWHAGASLASATRGSLVLRNVQFTDGGAYTVVITNSLGSVTSAPAILTPVGVAPFVIAPPQDTNVVCGDNTFLQVKVDGSAPFFYQWQFAGTNIDGATGTRLSLTNVDLTQAGLYSVLITNTYGSVSTGAVLTVTVQPPTITSLLTASGLQGAAFTYTIKALHSPSVFAASFLPAGLAVNPTNGVISGIPLENGTFASVISAANACSSDSRLLILNISSGVPVITSAATANGGEGAFLSYQITATGLPTSFGAFGLPVGLSVDAGSGLITGSPIYAGDFYSTILASNVWGVGSGQLHFFFTNAIIGNLNIGNVTYAYSSPYLLDFQFSLFTLTDPNDPNTATGVVVDPRLLSAVCLEDGVPTSASETGSLIVQGNSKLQKIEMVLDYTESIASLDNGDTNNNGISDAVDFMVAGAENFVNQQSADTQIGVYEFHRDDVAPINVTTGLTTDKVFLDNAIGGIWTNYVQGFSSGSRCWDAALAAIKSLGTNNTDEQHYLVLVSDGRDESSIATLEQVIIAATNASVKAFCIGFGSELDPTTLQALGRQTQGRFYTATNASDLATQFAQISKDAQGQYILRWATLKRSSTTFTPSFQISYQGLIAYSPTNEVDGVGVPDTNTPPNYTTNYTTNVIIAPYTPTSYAGAVTVGSVRLVPNADIHPTGIDLRATYVPRYVRQLQIHYRPNWPCTVTLDNNGPGQMLNGWSLSQTNDGAGGFWLLLSSPAPTNTASSLPFAAFGRLLTFSFQDVFDPSNAFSVFTNDNSIYTNIFAGGQSFYLANTNALITSYPPLPHGTPVPWLLSFGFSGNFTNIELLDSDGDGMPNWQEYLANTNPTNAASIFMVKNVARLADGRFQITFSTSTNRTYRVQASTDLVNWQTVQDFINGVNQDVTIIDTRFLPNLTNIFYRAVVY
jgi:hypothetical protein